MGQERSTEGCWRRQGAQHSASALTLVLLLPFLPPSPTFPWATNSRWAAEAAFTRALVAAAMDLAASRICSSKSRLSSACCGQEEEREPQVGLPGRWQGARGGLSTPSYLGLGPWLQLLQLLGRSLDGSRCTQQLVLGDDSGVFWVNPLRP